MSEINGKSTFHDVDIPVNSIIEKLLPIAEKCLGLDFNIDYNSMHDQYFDPKKLSVFYFLYNDSNNNEFKLYNGRAYDVELIDDINCPGLYRAKCYVKAVIGKKFEIFMGREYNVIIEAYGSVAFEDNKWKTSDDSIFEKPIYITLESVSDKHRIYLLIHNPEVNNNIQSTSYICEVKHFYGKDEKNPWGMRYVIVALDKNCNVLSKTCKFLSHERNMWMAKNNIYLDFFGNFLSDENLMLYNLKFEDKEDYEGTDNNRYY